MNAVIDVGSNSVRMLFQGKKQMEITGLAQFLTHTGVLSPEPMQRTRDAILSFMHHARAQGATVHVFATEAVRRAENQSEFVNLLKNDGIDLEILSPETEGKLGFLGAYTGGTQAVLDIGGASSELTVGDGTGVLYTRSLRLGAVTLISCGEEREVVTMRAKKEVPVYGSVPTFQELLCIGGTASTLAAVKLKLTPYDSEIIHNQTLTLAEIQSLTDMIYQIPEQERETIPGLHPKKIHTAPAGGVLLAAILTYLKKDAVRISERDNLEGYLKWKGIF